MANHLKFFRFNGDKTYNLDVVEKFLLDLEEKYGLKFLIDRLTFGLPLMAELCEKTLPKLAMDVAVFVVHVDESRLSINTTQQTTLVLVTRDSTKLCFRKQVGF